MVHVIRRLPPPAQRALLVASIVMLGTGLFFLLNS